ncbi:MAG TPA: PASTA domain-containing protein [Gaiellaceae bacterium]|nr:PASTA domain-containing protein [Gaiellaceae bacterium]
MIAAGVVSAALPAAIPIHAAPVPHARTPVVASLDPAATAALWNRLARGHERLAGPVTTDCRPLRAIFYAQTDWLRLATTLASSASPCAQYYISVAPLVADKTQERADQAWRIRALGSNFHALAEINMSAWRTWVTGGGGSWYQAGVKARKNMAAAGFDVSQGDTWAVNEFGSGVRQGSGTARTDARDFVRGLFDGDGTTPTAKGVVWTIGLGQGLTDPTTYKTNLENWLQDTPFWSDMGAYVSDWSQEAYGDFRNYGVAGSTLPTRRDNLNDFLQHVLALANAGPDTIATASSYFESAYTPLANAAWAHTSGYGWTSIAYDQMENYVSAQVYAMRSFSARQAQDRLGFAWAPTNSLGLSSTDFTTQTGAILDRLAAAIHDSAQTVDPNDPGVGACGPLDQNLWCNGQIDGASFNDAWKTFQFWSQLVVISAAQTLTAGAPSSPLTVQLQNGAGTPLGATSSTTVTLSSSSAQGMFATSPEGPWSSTLSVTIPAGASTTPGFYYEDTQAGAPTLTASAGGSTSATQTETVNPGPVTSIAVSPSSATVAAGRTQVLTASGADAYGNAFPVSSATWSVSPSALGTVSPPIGPSTTFTAGASSSSGSVIVSVGGIQGSVAVQTFTTYTLTVAKSGRGSGRVASSPKGIGCGSTCSHAYPYGTTVVLTATPAKSSTFKGWAGACSGTGTCSLSMKQAREATATFALKRACIVPKVTGNSLKTARRKIKRAHCRTGTMTRRYSTATIGRVISQNPHPKNRRRIGARVNLVISKGRRP